MVAILLGLIRHLLTATGVYFASQGCVIDTSPQALGGLALTIASMTWASYDNKVKDNIIKNK